MFNIPFIWKSFPSPFDVALKDQTKCQCFWPDLIWAAITVGKKEEHLLRYGRYSSYEIIYRAALMYANLMQGSRNQIYRTEAYDFLDPSEKGAVSYFIGTTMAKLFAERYLGVPWLMHLDVYRDELKPLFLKGKIKPDLVGQNRNGDWVVIEAKGRTNGITAAVIKKAKKQTLNLKSISGVFPVLRAATTSYFTNSGSLRVHLEDPEEIDEDAPDLEVTRSDFLSRYYAPFLSLYYDETGKKTESSIEKQLFFVKKVEDADLEVGIISTVLEAHKEKYNENLIHKLGFPFGPQNCEAEGVRNDGILVKLGKSWSEKKMRCQPKERHMEASIR